jgi:phage head maturation protease
MTIIGPRGWSHDQISTRFLSSSPSSFNAATRSVNACLSRGAPVKRFYGTEVLRISPEAVDLSRMKSAGIPLLDSHNSSGIGSALGRVRSVWFDQGALMGTLTFNQTPSGDAAMGMIERSEICSLSCGYRVESWKITDEAGNAVDEEDARFEDDLTFEATRWCLLECSVVLVPADSMASVRSLSDTAPDFIRDARARMMTRQRMVERMSSDAK